MAVIDRRALLQRAFHLLYHQLAWTYDSVSSLVSLGRWQSWGRVTLNYLPGPGVLELGHGPGHLLVGMAEANFQAIGLDVSPQMGRLARQRLAARGLPARLVRGQGQTLPFAAGSFNGVVATFPAPYILEPVTLTAIRHVLRPGGRLVIVPEAELTGSGVAVRATEWLFRITGQRSEAGSDGGDRQQVWVKLLGEFGFAATVALVSTSDSVVTVINADRLDDLEGNPPDEHRPGATMKNGS